MVQVLEINDIAQLADYSTAWDELLRQTAGASPFQTLAWLQAYWKHYGDDKTLRVFLVSRRDCIESADDIEGIVPMVVRNETTRVGALRLLTYPLDYWGSFYGPIGPEPGQALTAVFAHVQRAPRDWDVLEPRWLGMPDAVVSRTQQAMRAAGCQAYVTTIDRTAVVELQGGWDHYLATRDSTWRKKYSRRQRVLAKRGKVELLRYRPRGDAQGDGDPRWDLYDACEELARRSWQGASSTGTTLSHEAVRPFLRDAHAMAAAAGIVDLNLLTVDEHPVAFAYNYCYRGHVYGLRIGFDPQWKRYSVGMILCGRSVEDSFARGDWLYDMGVGSLDIKRPVQTRCLPLLRCSHYHPASPRSQLLRTRRWLQSRVNSMHTGSTLDT